MAMARNLDDLDLEGCMMLANDIKRLRDEQDFLRRGIHEAGVHHACRMPNENPAMKSLMRRGFAVFVSTCASFHALFVAAIQTGLFVCAITKTCASATGARIASCFGTL